MRKIIFVRHSIPKLEADVPPDKWKLTDEGRALCYPLAVQLERQNPDIIITSEESKAKETGEIVAGILGLPCQTAKDLHEQVREPGKIISKKEFIKRIEALFSNPSEEVLGLETAWEALDRFSEAVNEVMETHAGLIPVIVTHGTVMSLYYGKISGNEPFEFWKRLGIPALYTVTWPGRILESTIMKIDTPEKEL